MLENLQNMKVQFSVNLIIWFKVLGKLVKLSLTVKTGQTMGCWAVKTGIIIQESFSNGAKALNIFEYWKR